MIPSPKLPPLELAFRPRAPLVALPALAPLLAPEGTTGGTSTSEIALTLGITILKVIAFFAVMMLVGRRVIPWILHYIAHTGARELFRLGVLTIALGVAFGAAKLFGVSFALGAFFAGMILSESPLSQQAANESLPLRDAFAVLFFVSVGMLFNPIALVDNTGAIFATVAIISSANHWRRWPSSWPSSWPSATRCARASSSPPVSLRSANSPSSSPASASP